MSKGARRVFMSIKTNLKFLYALLKFNKHIMNDRKKGGRPKLSAPEKRKFRIPVMVNEFEYEKILEKSKKTGFPISTYMRKISIKGELKMRDTSKQIKLLRIMYPIANNLNQLAMRLNKNKQLTSNEIDFLRSVIKDLTK